MRFSKNFLYSEFDQKDMPESGMRFMDKDFLIRLDELRNACGFPFVIASGYRSPEYNASVSTTGLTGPHTTGKAADIYVYGENTHKFLEEAFAMKCFTGVGVSQKGIRRFIHLDTLSKMETHGKRKWAWSY